MPSVTLTVNGKQQRVDAPADEALLTVLRNRLDLTGRQVRLRRRAVRRVHGPHRRAADDLLQHDHFGGRGQEDRHDRGPRLRTASSHPVQAAFLEAEAFQCGYCTPGMVVACVGLLQSNASPSADDVTGALARNVCRCGTYPRILQAVQIAAKNSAAAKAGSESEGPPLTPSLSPRKRVEREKDVRREQLGFSEEDRLELSQHTVPSLHWFALDRRRFLQIFGGGLAVAVAAPKDAFAQESGRARQGQELPKDIAAWLHIDKDGKITVFTGKVEVGQNIRTSLAQQVAESCASASTRSDGHGRHRSRAAWDAGTFGSRTTPTMGPQLRAVAPPRARR
jgi:aerobic-type carbon monoxide dehydrogenase small subunit (CoxS/CutS family)